MEAQAKKIIEEQFMALPKPVQDAITSAEISRKMRAIAQKHQVHLNHWQTLEDSILLTVLGLADPEDLPDSIAKETGLPREQVEALVDDIAVTVFKPIRDGLERNLDHPESKPGEAADFKHSSQDITADHSEEVSDEPVETKKESAAPVSFSESYKGGEASKERKSIDGDPYREPIS